MPSIEGKSENILWRLSGIQVPKPWRRWTSHLQGDPSGSKQHNGSIRLTWQSQVKWRCFPFIHSAWVQETWFTLQGDTRGLVVYICDSLMIFLPFTSVFSFRVSCITASLTLFPFSIPSPTFRRLFSISGTFHSSVKNCHRLRDFLSRHHPSQHQKSGLFSTRIDSLHVYSILRLNWVLTALESIKISAIQKCLTLNTKFPGNAGEGAVNELWLMPSFNYAVHDAVKRFRVKRCRKSNHELPRLMSLVNSECRLHAGGMCWSVWIRSFGKIKNVSWVVLCSIWG